jgi:quinol monooxygenase YgiN
MFCGGLFGGIAHIFSASSIYDGHHIISMTVVILDDWRYERRHYMPSDKLILLIQGKVLPEHRAELLQTVRETLPLTRAETGVELLYPTMRRDDPNTLVFFEVFSSQEAYDSHMQQEYTKRFFATIQGCLVGEPVVTNLSELS